MLYVPVTLDEDALAFGRVDTVVGQVYPAHSVRAQNSNEVRGQIETEGPQSCTIDSFKALNFKKKIRNESRDFEQVEQYF